MQRTGRISLWWKAFDRRFKKYQIKLPLYLSFFYFKIKAGYRHPRSIPIISPSKDFDANVKKIFDKGSCTTFL